MCHKLYFRCILLFLLVTFLGCKRDKSDEVQFVVPPHVIYEFREDPEFHSFNWGKDEDTAVFMIHPHPAGLSATMVEEMADKTSALLEPQLKKSEGIKSVSRKVHDITAGCFSGREIDFKVVTTNGKTFYQCIYVLWDGDRVWQGQLTGPTEDDLGMAHRILQTKKK